MKKFLPLPLVFLVITTTILLFLSAADASADHEHHHHHHRRHHHHGDVDEKREKQGRSSSFDATRLFVFGDSYADTGNIPKILSSSWKQPYGITFPGKPAGRFSDGRVLTDFIAKYYKLKSPVPYRLMKYAGTKLRYGINFAYGGTGVLDTLVLLPNMTTQIDFFENLLNNTSVFPQKDLGSSLFLLAIAGNDYSAYTTKNGTDQGLPAFITTVVNQIGIDLKRLYGLGARKIVVTALPPLGCLPRITSETSYQQCNATRNKAVAFHNLLLTQTIANLNNQTKDSSVTLLDLFSSFTNVLDNKGDFLDSRNLRFDTPILKPCCDGVGIGNFCGSLNEKGEKLYTICNDRESAFFWDSVHPTQAGWNAVYGSLQSTLQLIH